MRFQGWAITGWAAVLMGAVIAAAVGFEASSRDAAREVVVWSTRFGAIVLSAVFAARPLRQLVSGGATRWLLRNRRYLGVAFAVMHFTHLGGLIFLGLMHPSYYEEGVDAVTLYGGGAVYVLLFAMTLTSFERTAAWLSRSAWQRLHRVGSWGLWGVMTLSYTGAALETDARYAPLALMLLSVAGLRAWVYFAHQVAAPSQPVSG